MSGWEFQFVGLEAMNLGITRVANWLYDMTPVWDAVKEQLEGNEANEFGAEGPGWAELADSTVQRRGSAHPILVDTGALRDSFTDGDPNNIYRPSAQSMIWGEGGDIDYGIYHQLGTVNMPARPLFDREHIKEAIGLGMHKAAVELGLLWSGAT